jgi:excisionase family DNA binding protein
MSGEANAGRESRLVRIADAAAELALSQRSIWRLIANGELDAVRIGRSVRVTRESIDRLIDRGGAA